jgi:hypothetical protein
MGGKSMAFDLRIATVEQVENEAKQWARDEFGNQTLFPILREILLLRQALEFGLRQDIAGLHSRLQHVEESASAATIVPEPKPQDFVRECAANVEHPRSAGYPWPGRTEYERRRAAGMR